MKLPVWRDYKDLNWQKKAEIFAEWCDSKGYEHDENLHGEEFVDSIPESSVEPTDEQVI